MFTTHAGGDRVIIKPGIPGQTGCVLCDFMQLMVRADRDEIQQAIAVLERTALELRELIGEG